MLPNTIIDALPATGQGFFARPEVWFAVFAALLLAGSIWQYIQAWLWRGGDLWSLLLLLTAAGYAAYQAAHLPGGLGGLMSLVPSAAGFGGLPSPADLSAQMDAAFRLAMGRW